MSPLSVVDLGPGVRAGFTDAAAGNLSLQLGDDEHAVLAHRARLAQWVGAPVAFGTQVHGAQVLVLDGPGDGRSVGTADAFVTSSEDLALGVLVADCVPVLLADPVARVVAAVHAGRGGLVAGVVGAGVAAMAARGAEPGRIRAALGPSIAGESYEVPESMRDAVAERLPQARATTSWGTAALDLRAATVAELARAGVTHVTRLDRDTFTDPALFSHRRTMATGAAAGRACGVVRLLPSR